ncbi:MAG: WD40 repeat domain-containing protein, partial [Gemmataceae bacterium]
TVRAFELIRSEFVQKVGHLRKTNQVAVDPTGKFLVSVSDDLTAKVWNLETGLEEEAISGLEKEPYAVTIAPGGRLFVGGLERKLRSWGLPGGTTPQVSSAGTIFAMTPADPGQLLVWSRTPTEQDEFSFLDLTGKLVGEAYTEKAFKAGCAALSSRTKRALLGGSEKGLVREIDLTVRKVVGTDWAICDAPLTDLGLTADGVTVWVLDKTGKLHVGTLKDRQIQKSFPAITPEADGWAILQTAPKGDRAVVVGADGEVKLFDMAGKLLRSWLLPVSVNGAAFTPNGKSVATANSDGSIYLLELP